MATLNFASSSWLSELRSATPGDLTDGQEFSQLGAATLTGPDPAGWTFDGQGPAPTPPQAPHRRKHPRSQFPPHGRYRGEVYNALGR